MLGRALGAFGYFGALGLSGPERGFGKQDVRFDLLRCFLRGIKR